MDVALKLLLRLKRAARATSRKWAVTTPMTITEEKAGPTENDTLLQLVAVQVL